MTHNNKIYLVGGIGVAAILAVLFLGRGGSVAAGVSSPTAQLATPNSSPLYSVGGLTVPGANQPPFSLITPPGNMLDFGDVTNTFGGNTFGGNGTGSADGATGDCGCGCAGGGAGTNAFGSDGMLAQAMLPLIQHMVADLPSSVADAYKFQYYGV